MEIQWQIDPEDVSRVRAVYAQYKDDPFVVYRRERNLATDKPAISRDYFWLTMVGALLTTQQRSGPDSPIARFSSLKPFPLRYQACVRQEDVAAFTRQVLQDFGGIRRWNKIADEVATNLAVLEQRLWPQILDMTERLRAESSVQVERNAARFVNKHLKGFGPKQARNLLQILGLTRYEIPIDSRITKWLNGFGFPLKLSAWALGDDSYYDLVSDGVQALCAAAGIYPCLLDAAIFTSYDRGGWTDENVVW
jgi:hypothetical protein